MSSACLRCGLCALLVCSLPAVAAAQAELTPEAQWRFNQGLSLVKEKAYLEAATEFKRAYGIDPNFTILLELGQAHAAAGQPAYAVEALGKYLSDGGNRVPQARREQVEAQIAEQKRLIATITVHCDLPGAVIRIDDAEVGKCPLPAPIGVNPGSHTLAASAADRPPQEHKLDLASKEEKIVEVQFQQSAAPAANAASVPGMAVAPTLPLGSTSGGSGKRVAYIVGGIGIGALAVGTVFGIRAISKRLDSDQYCPQNRCTQQGVDLNNQAKTAALVSDITLGAGLVGVVVATYLLLRPGQGSSSPPGTVAFGLRLSPEVGQGEAKLALGGSW